MFPTIKGIENKMKLKAWRYGEFFQGRITVYSHRRPMVIHLFEFIEQEQHVVWLVDCYPRKGLSPGMVLAVEYGQRNVLCEIIRRKSSGRFVLLPDSGTDFAETGYQVIADSDDRILPVTIA
jgi:hypothetical protein